MDPKDKFVKSNVIYTAFSTKQNTILNENGKRLQQTHVSNLVSELTDIKRGLSQKQNQLGESNKLNSTFVEGLNIGKINKNSEDIKINIEAIKLNTLKNSFTNIDKSTLNSVDATLLIIQERFLN